MKPILFSTPMVQAILDGRKTMTRRLVKPQPNGEIKASIPYEFYGTITERIFTDTKAYLAPCSVGDILYVRETWTCILDAETGHRDYFYAANKKDHDTVSSTYLCDDDGFDTGKPFPWKPSIHMPKAIARMFLRVTDVRGERLQDITNIDAMKEGVSIENWTKRGGYDGADSIHWRESFAELWDSISAKPKPQYETIDGKKRVAHYVSYPWEDIQETRTWRGKPWYVIGNPWVWAIEFERCEKP